MNLDGIQATAQTVRQLLTTAQYEVPVYQRNYAWGEEEIIQLIDDLIDASTDEKSTEYFLGNIVVSAANEGGTLRYSLIDGQQRLTTLHILGAYLSTLPQAKQLHLTPLLFESRPKAERALADLTTGNADENSDQGIRNGFRIISQYEQSAKLQEHLNFVLDNVLVARLELPADTDLNRYFEVMNTRGEQLQQQDIVKARMMAALTSDAHRTTFSWIWDACSKMDTYVQISLASGDTALRSAIFGKTWRSLELNSFNSLAEVCPALNQMRATGTSTPTLNEAIMRYAQIDQSQSNEPDEGERFSSIISFPVFLLHVLRVVEKSVTDEGESVLDDKRLIKRFAEYISSADSAQRAEEFVMTLLQCRLLFDAIILKREFTTTSGDDGIWSLKRVLKGENRSRGRVTAIPRYIGSFPFENVDGNDGERTDDSAASKQIRMLQAALRVTYTSPRTMHWITLLLDYAYRTPPAELRAESVLALLERYAVSKISKDFTDGDLATNGFSIQRITFTYLDYLLACCAGNLDFQFTFRNSIEHFYPQSPDAELTRAYGELNDPATKDLFGNLALVTVSDNSKFTNLPPVMKAKSPTVEQSPKLKAMAAIATRNDRAWNSATIQAHHQEMVRLLSSEISRFKP